MNLNFKIFFAGLFSFIFSIFFTKILKIFFSKKLKEKQRDFQVNNLSKNEIPSMGGISIIFSIILSSFFFLKLKKTENIILLFSVLFMGIVGFIDDFIKIFKKNKDGLKPFYKIFSQFILTFLVIFFSTYKKKEKINFSKTNTSEKFFNRIFEKKNIENGFMKTSIPFLNNYCLNYLKVFPENFKKFSFIFYFFFIFFIIFNCSNASNFLDGMDGIASFSTSIIGFSLIFFSIISYNLFLSKTTNSFLIENSNEIAIFSSIFSFSYLGFLWENSYPATIFMGDTGSLPIGSTIAIIFIFLKKELFIPIVCANFLFEALSVFLQTYFFKITKKIYGKGKRIFLCSPIHHHFQMKGIHESKITIRFIILNILYIFFAIFSLFI
jgi:phospho-N-acetylmuramoyl-pentapeptide-transferase